MTYHPPWKKRPMKRNTYPARIKRVQGPAMPTPDFIAGPELVISIDYNSTIMKPGSGGKLADFNAGFLLLQICAFTGAYFMEHGLLFDYDIKHQKNEITDAFNKAGLPAERFIHPHWTRAKQAGEPHQDFAARWMETHPDTQRVVFIGNKTFKRHRHIQPDFARVSSQKGFQMRHARRVVEALGSDWDDFKAYRRAELTKARKDKDYTRRDFKRP